MNDPATVKSRLRDILARAKTYGVKLGPYSHGLANSAINQYTSEDLLPQRQLAGGVYEADPNRECHCVVGAALLGNHKGESISRDAAAFLDMPWEGVFHLMGGWDSGTPGRFGNPWAEIGAELRQEFCPPEALSVLQP